MTNSAVASTWNAADVATCPHVTLTQSQIFMAFHCACCRMWEATIAERLNQWGAADRDPFHLHALGACGEIAASLFTGIRWNRVGGWRQEDCDGLEIKTRASHGYELCLKRHDRDDARFLLVTTNNSYFEFAIRGWISGAEAKRAEYWTNNGGVCHYGFFVPYAALRSPWELRAF